MASPIDPEMCVTTGRLMTEWFENAELTDEQVKQQALDHYGVDEWPKGGGLWAETQEEKDLSRKLTHFVSGRKNRKWRHGMTQQEVAYRMNEATKMVSPDNYKFLDDETRERTGLEVNPLWMMECLIRSGVMSPKEQIQGLKELAQYTHSKAPNVNTNVNVNAEDWLEELAKEEYKEIEVEQPKQRREVGAGANYEKRLEKRTAETTALQGWTTEEKSAMEALVEDAEWEEIGDSG